jgi:hypothetical protein
VLGELDEGLLAVEAARTVGVIRARIGRQPLAVAAQQFRDRRAVVAPGPVPQGDVDRAVPHVVELPDIALQVLVDRDALARILADEARAEHQHLAERRAGRDPLRHVLAAPAVGGVDDHRELRQAHDRAALEGDGLRDAVAREVVGVEVELMDFDASDQAHGAVFAPQALNTFFSNALRSMKSQS